jgi:Ca-activated chloride channel family protein
MLKQTNYIFTAIVISFVLTCLFVSNVLAQKIPPATKQPELTRILFLFDASQSMYARWETNTKYEVARTLLGEMVDSLDHLDNLELALRVYGHTKKYPPQDCDDTRLEVPFGRNNSFRIKQRLSEIHPSGTTPIARSLEESGGDFPDTKARNIIILITDGIEECNGDPCAVSLQLQKQGIVLKPFVIGLGLNKDFLKQFECVGNYFDASDEAQFRTAFNIVITQALNNTTAQVNLLDAYGKATETNVAMTFYDEHTGAIRYDFMHTINARGVPDTVQIDPLGKYRLVVHTLPQVVKDSITITPGKHNIIAVDAPQGDLKLRMDGSNEYRDLQAIVRKNNDCEILHIQDFNSVQRYLCGKYDLEILTMPRMIVKDVEVTQSKTTTVQIPVPGIATIQANAPGYGSIFKEEDNELKWIYTMTDNTVKESLVLQPGNYRIIFRPKNSQAVIYTIEKSFRITSGSSISVPLN